MMNAKKQQLGLLISAILSTQAVYALPQGAQVVQGAASFSQPNAATLNVTNSNNAIINWQQFNIGSGQTTNFIQPSSSSSVLNRVIGHNPSQLLGNLNSNGQVYLINQHGILVGEGARINTNGFFASTLNMTNEDYLNGDLSFHGGGLAGIDNHGYIHAGENGNVVLIAPDIENGGVIEVDNGNIILAAGKSITIKSLDNAHVEFNIQGAEDSVTNLGDVIAHNGAATLFAGTLRHSGSIKATRLVRDENGAIRLVASDTVSVNGSLDTSGDEGDNIHILADAISIKDGATIDASGAHQGGEILIGGDQQGLNPNIQNATSTTIEAGALVTASATQTGDGGRVIVFAQNDVHVHGDVKATGGTISGDGGFIETSGLQQLDITNTPDASATNGEGGDWLIDPNNITIQALGSDTNVDVVTGYGGLDIDSNDDGAIITTATIDAALLAGTNVIITTGIAGANQELGDINVNSAITGYGGTTLTLNAHNNINVNADITTSGFNDFNIVLNANSDDANGGIVSFDNATLDTNSGFLTLSGDSIAVNNNVNFFTGGGVISLNAPLLINALASLTIGDNGFTTGSINNSFSITNNGTLTIDKGDSDGSVSINGSIINNGLLRIESGNLNLTGGILDLNSGSTLEAPSGYGGTNLNLNSTTLNVNDFITVDSDIGLFLNGGTINDFQHLTLPDQFDIFGGIINFSDNIIINNTTDIFIGGSNPISFNNVSGDLKDIVTFGEINWSTFSDNGDINLDDTRLLVHGQFNINNFSVNARLNGLNSDLIIGSSGLLSQESSLLTQLDVPTTVYGNLELSNVNGSLELLDGNALNTGLNLQYGARLSGVGTFVGDVNVLNGGQISPGLLGGDDNTGTLSVQGAVTFDADSIGIFEIDFLSNGAAGTFDSLSATGNIFINGGELFVFWDNLTGIPTALGLTEFAFFTATHIVGAGFDSIIDPLNITASDVNSVTGIMNYDPLTSNGNSVVFWDGGGNSNNWSDAANWSTNTVPVDSDNVYIETSNVILDTPSANLGYALLDTTMNINAGSSLNTSVEIDNLGQIIVTDVSADIAGTALVNFNQINLFDANSLSVDNINNLGYFEWLMNIDGDFIYSGTEFENNGFARFYSLTSNNEVDVSGSANGILNDGVVEFFIDDVTRITGNLTSNNTGAISIVSITNNASTLFLADSNSSSGILSFQNSNLALENGITLTLGASSTVLGKGSIQVVAGSTLQVQDSLSLPVDIQLELTAGTLEILNNLDLEGSFIWSSGTINGFSSGELTTGISAITTLGSALDTTMTDVDWVNDGHVDWISSGGDFIINGGAFTNSFDAQQTFNVNTTGFSEIRGTGVFINEGHFQISALSVHDATNISVDFINDLSGDINIVRNDYSLVFDGHFTNSGNINFLTSSATMQVDDFGWEDGSTISGNGNFNTTGITTLSGSGEVFAIEDVLVNNTGNWVVAADVTDALDFDNVNFINESGGGFSFLGGDGIDSTDGASIFNNQLGSTFFVFSGTPTPLINTTFNNFGQVNISAGNLVITGMSGVGGLYDIANGATLTSNLSLQTALLTGNGLLVGDLNVDGTSTVSPGNSNAIGTLDINGNVVFEDGSTLAIEMEEGVSDQLNVTGGTTIITGAQINASGINGYMGINNEVPFSAVTASLGVSGSEFIVNQDLNFTLLYSIVNNSVTLTIDHLNNHWTGNVDASWLNNGNWSRGLTPQDDEAVFIAANQAVVNYDVQGLSLALLDIGDLSVVSFQSGTDLTVVRDTKFLGDIILDNANIIFSDNLTANNIALSNGANITIAGALSNQLLELTSSSLTTSNVVDIDSLIMNGTGSNITGDNSSSLTVANSIILDNATIAGFNAVDFNDQSVVVSGSSFLNDANLTHNGVISINENASLQILNGFLNTAASTSFEGLGELQIDSTGVLNLVSGVGFNSDTTLHLNGGTINTLGNIIDGNTVTVQNLNWTSGTISGNGTASLETAGLSALLNGTLQNMDWVNSGVLNWVGGDNAELVMVDSSFTNTADGVLNIFSNFQTRFANNDEDLNKTINGLNSAFINDGIINLFNATLDLGGLTLDLTELTSVLTGTGTIVGDVNNSHGTVGMGRLPTAGNLVINGDYTQGENGNLIIRIVDPVNGEFQFDTLTVNGVAALGGTLEVEYFSNQVNSITESFAPFTFSQVNGVFSKLVDSNNNILAVDLSNGGFSIVGFTPRLNIPAQDVIQSQEGFQRILERIQNEDLNQTLAFINEILSRRLIDDDDDDRAPRLVCI